MRGSEQQRKSETLKDKSDKSVCARINKQVNKSGGNVSIKSKISTCKY